MISNSHRMHHEPPVLQRLLDQYYEHQNIKPILLSSPPQNIRVNLRSNDFLRISNHPSIRQARILALEQGDLEEWMSPVFCQDSGLSKLEADLAAYLKQESVVLCQSGWTANYALLKNICSGDVPTYIDRGGHNSLWEGAEAGKSKIIPFRHNDMNHLKTLIARHGEGIIVVDSLYSTDGSFAPLRDVAALGHQFNCATVVDESHAVGVIGRKGEGVVASLGMTGKISFVTASLSKAFSTRAGLIASSNKTIEFIKFSNSPFMFSSKVENETIKGLEATLDIVSKGHDKRKRLFQNCRAIRTGLQSMGYELSAEGSQIVSIKAGKPENARKLREIFESHSVYGTVFCAPATPKNACLLRLIVHAAITKEELDAIMLAGKEGAELLGLNSTNSPAHPHSLLRVSAL